VAVRPHVVMDGLEVVEAVIITGDDVVDAVRSGA
jgi:hypothetical protein